MSIQSNRFHLRYVSDDKFIEQSNKRLNKIDELEQQAAFLCQKYKADAISRLNELKASENLFRTNLQARKCELAFESLKIDDGQQSTK